MSVLPLWKRRKINDKPFTERKTPRVIAHQALRDLSNEEAADLIHKWLLCHSIGKTEAIKITDAALSGFSKRDGEDIANHMARIFWNMNG